MYTYGYKTNNDGDCLPRQNKHHYNLTIKNGNGQSTIYRCSSHLNFHLQGMFNCNVWLPEGVVHFWYWTIQKLSIKPYVFCGVVVRNIVEPSASPTLGITIAFSDGGVQGIGFMRILQGFWSRTMGPQHWCHEYLLEMLVGLSSSLWTSFAWFLGWDEVQKS